MNRYVLGFIIFLIVLAGVVVFLVYRTGTFFGQRATTTLGEQEVTLRVADTEKERQIGLSETQSLGDNEGMVFLFDTPAIYSFWMKGMEFPIDIIFLDEDRVVTIHRDVPAPESENERLPVYQPTEPANKVLELNAGSAERFDINEGDTIDISL